MALVDRFIIAYIDFTFNYRSYYTVSMNQLKETHSVTFLIGDGTWKHLLT